TMGGVLQNGTLTVLLVRNWAGAVGSTDVDPTNDGAIVNPPWDAIVDGVAFFDGGASDRVYAGPVVLGPGFDGVAQKPGGASRIPDGQDTDDNADWVRSAYT